MKNKNIVLATTSARHFHLDNDNLIIKHFPDGEICINLDERIRGKKVFLVGSTQPPADNFMELILSISAALKRGARSVTVIIPYFGYARSDKEEGPSGTSNAKTIANILRTAGGKQCDYMILEPHSENLNKCFSNGFVKLDAIDQLAKPFLKYKNLTVVAPDRGSRARAFQFALTVNSKNFVVIEKERIKNSMVKSNFVSGDVTSNAVIVDDMVSSGNTVLETAKILKTRGADKIYIAVTHVVYSAGGWKKLLKSKLIDRIYTTDSIFPPKKLPEKFKLVRLSPMLKQKIGG